MLTESECVHIAKNSKAECEFDHLSDFRLVLRPTDFVMASAVPSRGSIRNRDRAQCRGCGKHSGLDDLVHNTLYGAIHTSDFMLDVLRNEPKGPSPRHQIVTGCGTHA